MPQSKITRRDFKLETFVKSTTGQEDEVLETMVFVPHLNVQLHMWIEFKVIAGQEVISVCLKKPQSG